MERLGVLTAALLMAVIAAGCSKDESSEEQKRNNMEQTNALTKEQIVGTWEHDGDAYLKDFSDIGTIKDGIIYDCKVEFSDYVPATLVFNSDGTLHLTVDLKGPLGVNCGGTYEIREENYNGALGFILRYDENYYKIGHHYFNYFRSTLMFFDKDYKTLYFTSVKDGMPNINRYRRVL